MFVYKAVVWYDLVVFWVFQCNDWHSSLWMRKLSIKNVVDPVHLSLKWCIPFTWVCMLLEVRILAEINISVPSKIIPFDKCHHSLIQILLAAVILVPFKDNQDQVSVTWNWTQKSGNFSKPLFLLLGLWLSWDVVRNWIDRICYVTANHLREFFLNYVSVMVIYGV